MQFKPLKVFCDVARNRSFSQAAQLNGVTQSAVSQMIAMLEEDMGVQLIDRSTRPLQLTALGKTYYDGCKELLEQYNELEASLKSAQALVEGSVQIAAIYSVGLGNMGQYVEAFAVQAPEAQVHVEYLHPNQVYEKVLEGSVDLGLVSFPRKLTKLSVTPWREEPMVLACPPGHPLAEHASVSLERLGEFKYVHFSKELGIRREVDRFFRAHKVSVDVALELDNIENIKKAIEIAAGVALLPEPTFSKEVASGTLVAVPLADAALARPLGIIYRRHHKLSLAAQRFLDLLCNRATNGTLGAPAEGAVAAGTDHKRGTLNSHHGRNGTSPAGNKKAGKR
jgi:DNA-binding transcriptional LysR family regulator